MSAIVKNAEANTNTALTVTIKPQGVTVKIGQEGYLTEAIIRKFYGCTNTLAASLVTGGVKLAKTPSLIRSEEQNPLELAAFFYRLQPLLQGGLEAIFANKESLPNLPSLKSYVTWKKPMLKIQADILAASFPKAFPKGQNVVPKAKAEEVQKPTPVSKAVYTDVHLKGCQRRWVAAVRRHEQKADVAELFKIVAFTVGVDYSVTKEVNTAIVYEHVTSDTLDAIKALRNANPNLISLLTETLVVFEQNLSPGNIGKDEAPIVNALNEFAKQGYDNADIAAMLDTLIDILNAV